MVHLDSVLVDRVRGHRAGEWCEKEQIDPGVVPGRYHHRLGAVEFRLEESWPEGGVDGDGVKALRGQDPEPRGFRLHLQSVVSICLCGDSRNSERRGAGKVEEVDVGVDTATGEVDPRLGVRVGIRVGFGVVGPIDGEDGMSSEHLRRRSGVDAYPECALALGFNHDGDAIAVEELESLNLLRVDVLAVNGIYPQVMLIDGEDSQDEVVGTNDVKSNPLVRLSLDDLAATSSSLASLIDTFGHKLRLAFAPKSGIDDFSGDATVFFF